jgi:hypothetical protein
LKELFEQAPVDMIASKPFPAGLFRRACRQLGLANYLEQAILLRDEEMAVGEWGADLARTDLVVERVRSTWNPAALTAQIQYLWPDDQEQALLLYTRPLGENLLTLVTSNDLALGTLRRIADALLQVMNDGEDEGADVDERIRATIALSNEPNGNGVYAIAWRPVEPMPKAMRQIVRESALRLARRKGCHLRFVGVASDHVHLVLHCPPQRKGSWAAFVFKRGIEQDIARRYGTTATLWQKGFLSDPSTDPIGGDELLAYLGHAP